MCKKSIFQIIKKKSIFYVNIFFLKFIDIQKHMNSNQMHIFTSHKKHILVHNIIFTFSHESHRIKVHQ